MSTTVVYQCPNCGAGLAFDAEKQLFACEFCLSEFSKAELDTPESKEAARTREEERRSFNESMNDYSCPSCGAEVFADASTVAEHCYYCHNPIVMRGRLSGQMRPSRVVPFQYDKKAAEDKFFAFVRKKWFLPRDFFARKQVERITGVYYPFWVTDADTDCSMNAHATRLRVWRRGNVEYTETSNFKIRRRGNIHFEDITTSAFSEADKRMLEGVLPYPSEALQEFSEPYLSGFLAKKRDIEREALQGEVRERMNSYASTLLRSTVTSTYNTVIPEGQEVHIRKSHWEYALMPVWILTYKSKKGKVYTYAMNGHTGKIYGELPISFGKLAALFAAVAVPVFALISLIGGML